LPFQKHGVIVLLGGQPGAFVAVKSDVDGEALRLELKPT